jgi:hypothetical protein
MTNSQNQNISHQPDTSSTPQNPSNTDISPPPTPESKEVNFTPDDMATSQFNEYPGNIQNF